MATTNRPNRISCDAFSDNTLTYASNNGVYNAFTNTLRLPLLGVKGVQLLRANFVNSSLPLNDYNGQLIFVYSRNTTTAIPDSSTFHVVRLLPSWYVPASGYTDYIKNAYFNNGTELALALTNAADTGGDSTTYNPSWLAGDVTFSFDTFTRKLSFTGTTASNYYAPVPADHPDLPAFLATYTGGSPTGLKMNALGFSGSYAAGLKQPYVAGVTMNERVGFAMGYNNTGIQWTSSSVRGCATTTGVPQANTVETEADSFPIFLGTQNLNIYCNVVAGSGQDSRTLRTLLATIPIENAPLGVCSYTLTSVDGPALSVGDEIYNLQFTFLDDNGSPFYFLPNYNVNLEMNIFYDT
jgi:hypothetical protein